MCWPWRNHAGSVLAGGTHWAGAVTLTGVAHAVHGASSVSALEAWWARALRGLTDAVSAGVASGAADVMTLDAAQFAAALVAQVPWGTDATVVSVAPSTVAANFVLAGEKARGTAKASTPVAKKAILKRTDVNFIVCIIVYFLRARKSSIKKIKCSVI